MERTMVNLGCPFAFLWAKTRTDHTNIIKKMGQIFFHVFEEVHKKVLVKDSYGQTGLDVVLAPLLNISFNPPSEPITALASKGRNTIFSDWLAMFDRDSK